MEYNDELREDDEDACLELELENTLHDLKALLERCRQMDTEVDEPSYAAILDTFYTNAGIADVLKDATYVWVMLGDLITDAQAALKENVLWPSP